MAETVHTDWGDAWHLDDGWGVLQARTVPEQVWAHYSNVDVGGFRSLDPGAEVEFTVERAEQDGYHWRAVRVKEKPPKKHGC
ncbi:cold-shock protein [Amycolatopsis sp. FDAARGOS 1241]|uniref:cold-shock protein n=1 Tax=Amycolatopsis sp. FDAARGOS 1241 TaxID=2778070 RepID=UPI0019517FAA|nr:cold shock domain-containing protein [Amycolatopsis sp. FDAARGOS 1241]QRP43766.1 cold shock domain-containing protein [Amycolatopsis sp. FDAARGOS 1241]